MPTFLVGQRVRLEGVIRHEPESPSYKGGFNIQFDGAADRFDTTLILADEMSHATILSEPPVTITAAQRDEIMERYATVDGNLLKILNSMVGE